MTLSFVDGLDYGICPDGVADNSAALAACKAAANTGAGGNLPIVLPPGRIKFTSQLALGPNATWIGAGSRPGNQGGTALEYAGADGQDWVVAGSPGKDWSNCVLRDIRIVKSPAAGAYTSGYALRVYNPTNMSSIENILVSGATDGQIYVDNATGGSGNPGPNFFRISRFFAVGGAVPLRIEGGVQQMLVEFGGIDLDVSSTHGVRVLGGEGQAFTATFTGVKVEGSFDVPGFHVSGISPVTFIGCTRYNNALNGHQGGFVYENPPQPNCQVLCLGCTTKGTVRAFHAPDLGVTVTGSQAAGRQFNYLPAHHLVVGPFSTGSDQNKAFILHNASYLAWTDGVGATSATDTTVKRAAAGKVNVGKLAVGNGAAASTLGSVKKKVEIFDASGVSLGFVPVYDVIT